MSIYVLAAFLILFGVSLVASTSIPGWVSGVLAIAAGLLLLAERGFDHWRKPRV